MVLVVIAIGWVWDFKKKLYNVGLIYSPLYKRLFKLTPFLPLALASYAICNLVDDLSSHVTSRCGRCIIPPSKDFSSLGFSSTTSTTSFFNWSWSMLLCCFKCSGFLSNLLFSFQNLLQHLYPNLANQSCINLS